MDRGRRSRGTSLIEILVVIVVLLVGILAVVQIFPRGFRLLVLSRNTTMATALARSLGESLVARPDEIPEQILPIRYDVGLQQNVLLTDRTPNDMGPVAPSLDANGNLILNGDNLGNWQFQSGANVFRRLIGETHVIPTPRATGNQFGSLLVLPFGPMDWHETTTSTNILVYGDDLARRNGVPDAINERGAPEDRYFDELDESQEYEYFVRQVSAPTVGQVFLPTADTPRDYVIRFSGYVGTPANYTHRDFSFPVHVNSTTRGTFYPQSSNFPLFRYEFGGTEANQVANLLSVDFDSIRVARAFTEIGQTTTFDDGLNGRPLNPYEYKILDTRLGVLLFNPASYNLSTPTPTGRRPLRAKVDYDVYDWRILHEDFRVGDGLPFQYQLAVPSLKVGTQTGPDGRANGGIVGIESGGTNDAKSDNLVLVDVETGGILYERFNGSELVQVDKSRGIVNLLDSDSGRTGLQGEVHFPDNTDAEIDLTGRTIRALYMSRQEWAVQFLKGASQYSIAYAKPTTSEFYIGGSAPFGGVTSRIYFSPSDAGRKVNIGELRYIDTSSNLRVADGQDFVISFRTGDPTGLPSIDIKKDLDGTFQSFDFSHGTPARQVKGASLTVRVTWNPDAFTLVNGENIDRLEKWGRGTRHSSTDTYLQRGDNIR